MFIILDTHVANCIITQMGTGTSVQTNAVFKGLVGLWSLRRTCRAIGLSKYS